LVYVHSGANALYEKNVNTGSCTTYVYGPTGRIAKNVDGLRNYNHTDRLGSTRLVTDESGNSTTSTEFDPFGKSVTIGEEEHYLYTGKEMDLVGLYYFGARYYDPAHGRFMTRDAMKGDIRNPQSLNLYVYCLNNPVRYYDPLGFKKKTPEEIVQEIFDYLNNLGEDAGLGLEEYFTDEDGNPLSNAEGLIKLIRDLGFEIVGEIGNNPEEVTLTGDRSETADVLRMTIQFESTTIEIVMYDDPYMGGFYGDAPRNTNKVILNVSKHQTAAELAAGLCHELCHRVLEKEYPILDTHAQHAYIYPVHLDYNKTLPVTQEYRKKHEDARKLEQEHYEGRTGNGGMCLGSMILGNLVFLGLFVMRTLKKDDR
jgi:RHS repeat-associated protein